MVLAEIHKQDIFTRESDLGSWHCQKHLGGAYRWLIHWQGAWLSKLPEESRMQCSVLYNIAYEVLSSIRRIEAHESIASPIPYLHNKRCYALSGAGASLQKSLPNSRAPQLALPYKRPLSLRCCAPCPPPPPLPLPTLPEVWLRSVGLNLWHMPTHTRT